MDNRTLYIKAKGQYAILKDDEAAFRDTCDELAARLGVKSAAVKKMCEVDAALLECSKANMQIDMFETPILTEAAKQTSFG